MAGHTEPSLQLGLIDGRHVGDAVGDHVDPSAGERVAAG